MDTMYDFYHKVASTLSKKNADAIFDYIIHSMDDNGGFLRSRFCYWEKTLPDRPFHCKPQIVLVALQTPFDFDASTDYYEEAKDGLSDYPYTKLKMQLFYTDASEERVFRSDAEWSAEVGYPYYIKVDLAEERRYLCHIM